MKIELHVWPEAALDFEAEGLGPGGTEIEIDPLRLIGLADRFDLMIRTRDGNRVVSVSRLGRGFSQR